MRLSGIWEDFPNKAKQVVGVSRFTGNQLSVTLKSLLLLYTGYLKNMRNESQETGNNGRKITYYQIGIVGWHLRAGDYWQKKKKMIIYKKHKKLWVSIISRQYSCDEGKFKSHKVRRKKKARSKHWQTCYCLSYWTVAEVFVPFKFNKWPSKYWLINLTSD